MSQQGFTVNHSNFKKFLRKIQSLLATLLFSVFFDLLRGAPWAVTRCFLRYHLFLTTLSQMVQLTPCDWICTLTMCCLRLKLFENVFQQQLQSLGCIQRHLCLGWVAPSLTVELLLVSKLAGPETEISYSIPNWLLKNKYTAFGNFHSFLINI